MADATVSVLMTAEESRLHQAVMNAAAAFAQLDTGVAKVAKSSRDAAKEEEALGRAAKRVFDETRTPQEQYNARMEHLNKLVKAGATDQETFRRAAKQAGDELKNAGDKGLAAFGPSAVSMAKGFLAALGIDAGIAGAVHLIKAEWENVEKVQKRVLEATLPTADAQAKFRMAAGFGSAEEAATFDKEIEAASKISGVVGKELYLDAAAAMENRHGLSKKEAMEAAKTSAELFPADAEKRREFAQSILGVQQATHVGVRRAAGWLLSSAQQAGVPTGEISHLLNALPEEDPREVIALAQALGTTMKASPTRAILGMVPWLAKNLPEGAGENISQRLAYMKEHPELLDETPGVGPKGNILPSARETLLKAMSLKGNEAKINVLQLLTGKGGASAEFNKDLAANEITNAQADDAIEKNRRGAYTGPMQVVAKLGRDIDVVTHQLLTSRALSPDAATAQAREKLLPLLTAGGELEIAATFANFAGRLSGDYLGSMQSTLERAAQQRLHPVVLDYGSGGLPGGPGYGGAMRNVPRQPTEKEVAQGTALLEAAKILREVAENLKAANAAKPTLGRPDSRN